MTIQVLGTGCPTCKKLFELTKQAVAELKLDAQVEYIDDIEKIMAMGVMSSPVLAVDNVPVVAGMLPSFEKIKKLLSSHEALTPEIEAGSCSCSGKR